MSKQMLIDAAHPEETRVAIIDNHNLLLEYDCKSSFKSIVKGNIYLAKVARVEPSLQAAFVDYGGNRHGFLAFSEIHPDYFRIPVADREKINAELKGLKTSAKEEQELTAQQQDVEVNFVSGAMAIDEEQAYKMPISTVGGDLPLHEDDDGENYIRRLSLHRRYKIQEVVQRNQILLIQVVKEERGNKGAALTTYLSMPGRYCVLMPNSPSSGGISRKISNPVDRKRLRKVLDSLEIPDGMGLIIRTAGKERTKVELKRDAEYLMRLWNTIRETTLSSTAPALIYQEDEIIKRAIRDLYTKDIDMITVEGEDGFKEARNFMKTLMPSHLKRIAFYKNDSAPLFHHFGIERQIDQMHEAQVFLPSGGSIVIHPTEALISIDINSGRATRERHIEETAVKTNLEAAPEIARQVKLRDHAGLIVIDFIDMNDHRNINAVERRVKEVFRNDRARVQVGKISPFGLLELSRQRLSPSIIETSAYACPHCDATGYIRSTESKTLQILRNIEEHAIEYPSLDIMLTLPSAHASYIFNKKRQHLYSIEQRHHLNILFQFDETLEKPGFKLMSVKNDVVPAVKTITNTPGIAQKTDDQIKVVNHHASSADHKPNAPNGDEVPSSFPAPGQGEGNRRRGNRRRSHHARRNQTDQNNDQNVATDHALMSTNSDQPGLDKPASDKIEPRETHPVRDSNNDSHNNNANLLPNDHTDTGNTEQPYRRNNRRHVRSHRHRKPQQAGSESDSTPPANPLNHIVHAPQDVPPFENQNLIHAANQTTDTPQNVQQTNNQKGWWKRLLE